LNTKLENWIIYDHNPFIIFSNSAKIIYTNEAGEYLLSFICAKEIFETIIKYAPKDIGFLHIRQHFVFKQFSYDYALIGYDNYDEIGVRFYQNIKPLPNVNLKLEKLNIYFIIDLVRTYVFIDKEVTFKDLFDVDLPDINFDKETLIKILSAAYEAVKENETIFTSVHIKIGEYVKFQNKKYKVLEILIQADNITNTNIKSDIIDIVVLNNQISLLLPFVT